MRTIVLICLSDLAPIPLMKISVAYHMSLSPGHDGGLVKPLFWGTHARDGSQVSYKFSKIFPWNVYSWSFDKEILYNYWPYVIQSVLCFAEALVFLTKRRLGFTQTFLLTKLCINLMREFDKYVQYIYLTIMSLSFLPWRTF